MSSSTLQGMDLDEYMRFLDISYEEIESATNRFADENLLTQGTCFKVYKGQLLQSGELIDVVVRKSPYTALMYTEVDTTRILNHKNIASVFKFCQTEAGKIIINKYEVNGSLEKHLSGPTLTWMQRLHICVGVAHALKYLQHDTPDDKYVIHGNIKASKILLDHNWEPKLHGFGFAVRHQKYGIYLRDRNCVLSPYLDPSIEITRGLTRKSDIFSFGVVLFEVLFGRKASIQNNDNWYFAGLARSHYERKKLDDLIDPDLRKQMNLQSLEIFAEIAFYCVKESRSERPFISEVVSKLEKALELQHKHEHPITASAVGGTSPSHHLKVKSLDHLKFRLRDIKLATDDFSKRHRIGSGAYGEVYKAQLNLEKTSSSAVEGMKHSTLAIKRIFSRNDKQGEQGFLAEIEMLCRCKHPNIVCLQGFCDEEGEMILVYEYVSNGCLTDYLGDTDKMRKFTWAERIKICLDIARGLHYLHTSTQDKQCIIHRDIKSENILLDDNWVAKIADFGFSKLHHTTREGSTLATKNIAGTKVYMDPEYQRTGKLKAKSDVYSFGVVMFEIMSGKPAYDATYGEKGIPPIARQCFNEKTFDKLVDPKLMETDENIFMLVGGVDEKSLNIYTNIAYQCLAETQSDRPTMEVIIDELEKSLNFQINRKNNLCISLKAIQSGTDDFSDKNCIGDGFSWKLYEGNVEHANEFTTIFAKRWSRPLYREFQTEIQILVKYKHVNIIGLVGCCSEMGEHIIVYEHASNGRLDKHLENPNLTWMQRLKICISVANGLEFLHKGGGEHRDTVTHGCIDSGSILLDSDWNARISNFEFSCKHTTLDNEGYSILDDDVYSLGLILTDILCGRLAEAEAKAKAEGFMYRDMLDDLVIRHYEEKGNLDEIIFEDIKKQIAPKSLIVFQSVIIQCLKFDPLTTSDVVIQLQKALKFQEDYEIWEPKLPIDYKEIIEASKSPEIEMKRDLYDMFSKGILLHDKKVLFSLGDNGERNEMISAMMFSYKRRKERRMLHVSESRFQKVAEVFDITNLKIQIRITTQLLSPDVNYGAYLIFKFCAPREHSNKLMFVNLKYKKGREHSQAYFATWRDENWMMIELYQFLCEEKNTKFDVLLEGFSRYHCGNTSIHIEGIEFRVINKVKNEEIEQVQQNMESDSNKDQPLLLNEVNIKKHLMLSAMEFLYDSSNANHFHLQPSTDSRFSEVLELLPQQAFRINCKVESQILSQDTNYFCYLVFKLSDKCVGLHCPVIVRDLVRRNKNEAGILYFRSPSPWNLHENIDIPQKREDGWMEVKVWKFNSSHQCRNDCIPVNLKLISYKEIMFGLIVCGLEFRPITD